MPPSASPPPSPAKARPPASCTGPAGRHIEELALPSGGAWQADDLTAVSGAPDTASAPFGYTTSLTGQVPAARVVYRAAGNDIEELSAG